MSDSEERPAKRARTPGSWRPFEGFADARGHPHALAVRRNVLLTKGSALSVARERGVCPQSVRDFRALLITTGDLAPLPRSGGPSFKLSPDDAYALYLYSVLVPDALREEVASFLLCFRHVSVSESTISNCKGSGLATPGRAVCRKQVPKSEDGVGHPAGDG